MRPCYKRYTLNFVDSEAKNYEVAYLLSPTLAEADVLAYAAKVSALVEELGGMIRRVEQARKYKLAYAIKKEINTYFGWTTFRIQPEKIAEFDKRCKAHTETLRFLIVEEEIEKRKPFIRSVGARTSTGVPARAMSHASSARETVHAAPEQQDKRLDLEALDKKLEEILGR